jgi:hypothetical protein
MSLIRSTEDRAAKLHDSGGRGSVEDGVLAGRKQAFEPVSKTDNLPVQFFRRFSDPAEHGI